MSVREDRRLIEVIIKPQIGSMKALEVTRSDIAKLHHEYRETPYQANRLLALLKKMFNLAEKWGLRPDGSNPCRHVEKFREEKRRRFLNLEELATLGTALTKAEEDGIEPPAAIAAIRLLMLTGARLSEILNLRWGDLDWELGAMTITDSKTGFKSVPLSAPAIEILKSIPVIEGNDYVIAGRKKGKPLVGLQHVWQRIRKEARIEEVRLHDLRHGFASVVAAAGLGLPIIAALLGHRDVTTTQRYAHLAQDPLRLAAEVIAGKIDRAMKAKPKVVAFKK